jgi:hypothetical protein
VEGRGCVPKSLGVPGIKPDLEGLKGIKPRNGYGMPRKSMGM